MRKKSLLFAGTGIVLLSLVLLNPFRSGKWENEEENENEAIRDRYIQHFEQLRDPALNQIPNERLLLANEATKASQRSAATSRTSALNWEERGPVFDFVGPNNPNRRAGNEYTAGVVNTFLVDFAGDPTGNTVLSGSPSGGLWRCTNFLATAAPNWQPVNDFQSNLAISSICQDPSNPSTMYIATGDAGTVALSGGVRGYGVWKSTNSGLTWSVLPATTSYLLAFKVLCDNTGNVYLATGGGGLRRSSDGGATWTIITPSNASSVANNSGYVTDLEISSTGRLHAIFGYYGSRASHFYTDNPATVSSASGWMMSNGIRSSTVTCTRIEIATQGNVMYAVTANSSFNVDSCYRSTDGGENWTLQNSFAYTTSIANSQAWFALTLEINPDNPDDFIVGSVDAYRSLNSGATVSRATYWVGLTAPYVHADHHTMKWMKIGSENRIIIGSDGGMFLSRNGGVSFVDRNQNLGIKQFYSCAISPTSSENYMIAGSQDNGCHQLTNPGLNSSVEFYGGDGAFVHINQQNKQIQFGSYVYNVYRRSTNGGSTWSSFTHNANTGYFINPYDYDDALDIMYMSNAANTANNQIRRWSDANTTNTSTVLTVDELTRGGGAANATAFKVSPYTAKRVYIGSNRGGLLRLENANTVSSSNEISNNITDITGSSFPTAYLNCINTGSSDNFLVATFTNYGVNNIWISTNGGTSWTTVDGNLPDMPVWWAVFVPGNDNKMIIATEAGVYTADALNGSSTIWTAEPNFPIVRTRMLKIRSSDNTIVAATYGRGLWTATINGCALATVSTHPQSQSVCPAADVTFNVTATGTGITYQWRKGGVNINGATSASYTINNVTATDAGTYDVVITNSCGNTTSSQATLSINANATINTQPASTVSCAGSIVNFSVAATGPGLTYQWRKGGTNISGATNNSLALTNISATDAGSYDVAITTSCGTAVTSATATLSLGSATAIGTQPATQTVCAGTNVILNVGATGGGTLAYQWRKSGTAITGATTATYTINSAGTGDAGNYDVIVTGSCGNLTSAIATLSVNPATVVTNQPAAQTGCAGTAANFSVTATGTGALSYQWRKNSIDITGATSATYSIPSTAIADAGNYDVVVTGSCGPVTSLPAILTVNTGGGCVTAIPNVDADVTTLVLMPNTVLQSAVLRIKVQRPIKVDWSIVDAQGRVVMAFTQKLTTGQTDMPLQLGRLAAGIYYLTGITEKGKLGTLRFEKL